jgi:hypothetical protein
LPQILGEREGIAKIEPFCGRERARGEREPAGEILSERSESKDLLLSRFAGESDLYASVSPQTIS